MIFLVKHEHCEERCLDGAYAVLMFCAECCLAGPYGINKATLPPLTWGVG